jgi:uncharacterized protein YodC (DUF2158 family)
MISRLPNHLEPEILEGATVQLRSGGQSMTIEEITGDQVCCVWFDKGQVRREVLPVHVLKRNTEGVDFTVIMQNMDTDDGALNA